MTKAKIVYLISIITILIFVLVCYQKLFFYTLDEVSAMLNSVKLSKNVYIRQNDYTDDYTSCTDIYIKDDIKNTYYRRKSFSSNIDNSNFLSICEAQKLIDIDNMNKTVTIFNVEKNYDMYIPNKYSFFNSVEQHGLYEHLGIYKYCGKENIDGKKCIKISFTDNNENSINIDYYYIDIESNLIIKFQSYVGENIKELKLTKTIIWEYRFDVVTDSDIVRFDVNNYQDYEFYEF